MPLACAVHSPVLASGSPAPTQPRSQSPVPDTWPQALSRGGAALCLLSRREGIEEDWGLLNR